MTVTLLEERPECRFGHVGSVLVSIWYNEVNIGTLESLTRYHRALASKHGKITFISVVVSAKRNASPEVREYLKTQSKELTTVRHANIIVVLARGLGAIIARTFLAALSLISSEKMVVFSTLADAVELAKRVPGQDEATKNNETLLADLEAFVALPAPGLAAAAGQ